jgi:16S rRNA (adenine1518-N6/adenine1519-N6)-dimethyltransferase
MAAGQPDDYSSPKRVLAARALHPRKRLGQHFLVDAHLARRMAARLPSGAFVLEIGGGTGTLTQALIEIAREVEVIEIDRGLASVLADRFPPAGAVQSGAALRVLLADALSIDLRAALESHAAPRALCGNLPYYITTPLLERALACADLWQRALFMVQREYARRLCARPATPEYGSLTVFVAYRCRVERLFDVGAAAFYPAPDVASSALLLEPKRDRDHGVADERLFLWLVRAAFAHRRKTFVNSVVQVTATRDAKDAAARRAMLARALDEARLDARTRAERLDLAAFIRLSNALHAQGFSAPAR